MKTLIELFDSCQIENISAPLLYKPKKVVFVGFDFMMTERRCESIRRFFRARGISAQTEFFGVNRYDFDSIVSRLESIIDDNIDCAIDITGGRELPLAAAGFISAKHNVPLFQLNIRKGSVMPLKHFGEAIDVQPPKITVEDHIALYGGLITHRCGLEFDAASFDNDISRLWNVFCSDTSIWNKQSRLIAMLVRNTSRSSHIRFSLNDSEYAPLCKTEGLVTKLHKCGLVHEFHKTGDVVSFRFKNSTVRNIITKAGTILELYTHMLAKKVTDKHGNYVFSDSASAVCIDWDGTIHSHSAKEKDTANEVDVMLMRCFRPVFISCKGGDVKKEALYELSAIANRFGGIYSTMILVCTSLGENESGRSYLLKRARDMKIHVIEGVEKMTYDQFESALEKYTR